jgi:hypothetical protein
VKSHLANQEFVVADHGVLALSLVDQGISVYDIARQKLVFFHLALCLESRRLAYTPTLVAFSVRFAEPYPQGEASPQA